MSKKILIVDDESDIVELMNIRLSTMGYEVLVAEDGAQAFERLEETVPDLLLLDLTLPDMDGLDIARKLKSQEKFSQMPIILFTASPDRIKDISELESKPIDDCILKPFEPKELIEKLHKFLGE